MAVIRAAFRGLNTDQPVSQVPSGTADIAENVTVANGVLRKRGGFSQFEGDVKTDGTRILSLTVAQFADGDTYVVAKLAASALYRRKVGAGSFTVIAGGQTHNTNDPGWWFMWADRLHHFDRVGGTRWNPDTDDGFLAAGTAYKAGLRRPTAAMTFTAAAGGEKEGRYHVHMVIENSTTLEESIAATTHDGEVETRLSAGTGGLAASNWNAFRTNDRTYEWDTARAYCTIGSTEFAPWGAGAQSFSYRAYKDASLAKSSVPALGLNKADHILRQDEPMTNAGGEPPGAQIGMWTGLQGVYGRIFESAALVGDKIMFSIPRFPTMVPQRAEYSVGGDAFTFVPKPWEGVVRGGMAGAQTAMAYGGGQACVFGPTSAWILRSDTGDGRLFPTLIDPSRGAAGTQAVIGTPAAVHALGVQSWLRIAPDGFSDLAQNRFQTTLEAIPLAAQTSAVMGYYSFKDQVWAAVGTPGGVIQTILVLDFAANPNGGELTIFTLRDSLFKDDQTESITAMTEYAYPSAAPTMLIGTNKGRILQYPVGSVDAATAGNENYVAKWRGYFGTERLAFQNRIVEAGIHAGANVAGDVEWGLRGLRVDGEKATVAQTGGTLTKDSLLEKVLMDMGNVNGRFFQFEFSSANDVATQWTISDFVLRIRRSP